MPCPVPDKAVGDVKVCANEVLTIEHLPKPERSGGANYSTGDIGKASEKVVAGGIGSTDIQENFVCRPGSKRALPSTSMVLATKS